MGDTANKLVEMQSYFAILVDRKNWRGVKLSLVAVSVKHALGLLQ